MFGKQKHTHTHTHTHTYTINQYGCSIYRIKRQHEISGEKGCYVMGSTKTTKKKKLGEWIFPNEKVLNENVSSPFDVKSIATKSCAPNIQHYYLKNHWNFHHLLLVKVEHCGKCTFHAILLLIRNFLRTNHEVFPFNLIQLDSPKMFSFNCWVHRFYGCQKKKKKS